jgi:hypothetical protein
LFTLALNFYIYADLIFLHKYIILTIKTFFILITFWGLFYNSNAFGQKIYKMTGVVQDSTRIGVPNSNVRLIAGKDTLSANTDTFGNFSFTVFKADKISLLVRSIGYLPFEKSYSVNTSNSEITLETIVLRPRIHQLKEVVIKAKVVAMRLMKDTIEFNPEAYIIREGDRVADLLKQLPGIHIGRDGNVTSAGKTLTKIRVNGKDFFTGNVKEFIAQLPAHIVSRLQIIDDYGDHANFTGIKNGEPQKMLNLVIKPGEDKGDFGGVSAGMGTNDRYGVDLKGNFWRGSKQIGINSGVNNTNNGVGISNTFNTGINYRNTLSKTVILSGTYNYDYNRNSIIEQNYLETINPGGSIYTLSNNETLNRTKSNNFNMNLQSNGKSDYVQGNVRGALGSSIGNVLSSSSQTGVIRQDLLTHSLSNQNTPSLNADFTLGHRFIKPGRIISVNFAFGESLSRGSEILNNTIGYYKPFSDVVAKDSILNRIMSTRNRMKNLNAGFTFSEPLDNGQNKNAKKSLDIIYSYAIATTNSHLQTSVDDNMRAPKRVDSLSNKYTSSFATQRIGLNYRYGNKKINYNIGMALQPSLLKGVYEGLADKVESKSLNLFPVMRFDFTPSTRNSFGIYYDGYSIAPSFSQLQPVPDLRNLQNVIIGNPSLKAAFNHSINLTYRSANPDNNSSLQILLNGSMIQNQVVINTVLKKDTLNSLKQETQFQNTNGNYKMGGNYYWNFPFLENKLNFEMKGGFSYDRQVTFNNDLKNFGKGLGFNQGVGIRINQTWLILNTGVDYSYRKNTYSLEELNSNTIQSWTFNLDYNIYILKSLLAGVSTMKTINEGYALRGNNPLIVSGYLEKSFFKNKVLNLKFEANDLLNQGNIISRSASGNSISETKGDQVTRYFLFSLSLNLQRFGK